MIFCLLKKLKIFARLFLTHTAIGLVSVVSLSVIFYLLFLNALIQRTSYQLSSINILKKNNIEEYLGETQKNLELHFGQKNVTTQYLFSRKSELSIAKRLYDFKSIIAVDTSWNLITGTTEDSLLLEVVKTFRERQRPVTAFQIIEAASVVPMANTILVYVVPLSDGNAISGYVFVEDDFNTVQKILLEIAGMGDTGESYLVGKDLRMRSRSRFNPSQAPSSIEVNTDATRDAFSGASESGIISDYR